MLQKKNDNKIIKEVLSSSKTIAMIGVSSAKIEKKTDVLKRRPSIIVMKYMQEFGYKVIPVNPFSKGQEINGEKIVADLKDIKIPIDIVNVFRPSKEATEIAEKSVIHGAKVLWMQYGIENDVAKKIVEKAKMICISNKCIKQEYQRLFLKVNPVFPVLQSN